MYSKLKFTILHHSRRSLNAPIFGFVVVITKRGKIYFSSWCSSFNLYVSFSHLWMRYRESFPDLFPWIHLKHLQISTRKIIRFNLLEFCAETTENSRHHLQSFFLAKRQECWPYWINPWGGSCRRCRRARCWRTLSSFLPQTTVGLEKRVGAEEATFHSEGFGAFPLFFSNLLDDCCRYTMSLICESHSVTSIYP